MRTSKTVDGVKHTYIYASGKLLRETYDTNVLDFFYDANGNAYALKYNGTVYYYITNLQGDVTAILNTSGTAVVQYTYDAWGKLLSTTGSMASTLGAHNPLRYRAYVYDQETQLYYLQSRYYNPAMGRFINADAYPTTGQGVTGNNMFSYCGNNPVCREDDGGTFWHIVAGAALGAIVNGAITIASNLLDKDPETDWNDGLGMALATGAVTGGFAASGCGPAVQMAVNAAATAVEGLPGVIDDLKKGENVLATLGSYAFDIGVSAVTSYSGGLGSRHATNLGKQTVKRTWNAFVHDGIGAGFSEMGKAAKWYWKSAGKLIKNIAAEHVKAGISGLAEVGATYLFS